MRAYSDLLGDFITRLKADGLLTNILGGTSRVYSERPPSNVSDPFIVVDLLAADAWNNQSYRGTRFSVQVSAYFPRLEQGGKRGDADVAQAGQRIRDVLDDIDGFDLTAQEPPSESLRLSFGLDTYEQNTGTHRLAMRQYSSGNLLADGDGAWRGVAARFICLVGE